MVAGRTRWRGGEEGEEPLGFSQGREKLTASAEALQSYDKSWGCRCFMWLPQPHGTATISWGCYILMGLPQPHGSATTS